MIFRLATGSLILALMLLGCDGEESSPAAGASEAPTVEQGQAMPEALPSTDPVEPQEFEQLEPAPLPTTPGAPTTAPMETPTTAPVEAPTAVPTTDATEMNIAPATGPATAPITVPSPGANLGALPSTDPVGEMHFERLATPEISTRPVVIPQPGDVHVTTDPITELPTFTRMPPEGEATTP